MTFEAPFVPAQFVGGMSEQELFFYDAFAQVMFGVEEQGESGVAIFANRDFADMPHLGVVGHRTDWPDIGIEHVDSDGDLVRQDRATPMAGSKHADWGQR